jgi:hypothetical protein
MIFFTLMTLLSLTQRDSLLALSVLPPAPLPLIGSATI